MNYKSKVEKQQQIDSLTTEAARFRSLVEVSSDWIWEVDKNAIYTYSSPKVKELLGYTPEEIIGNSVFELMPVGEAGRVISEFEQIVQKQEPFNGLENINQHKDGHLRTLETSGVPIFDEQGEFCGYRGVDRDITVRKQKEKSIALSKHHLIESQRIARLGHWDWNITEETLYWSDEIYRIFGLDPQQFCASYEAFLQSVHADDREMVEQAVNEALTKNNYNIDHRIVLPHGEVRIVHEQAEVQFNKDGQAIQMLGTVQDITERKHLENALNTIACFDPFSNISEYYKNCVENIARVYNTRYAFIGLYSDESLQRITTQAVWANGEFIDNFEYELKGTPCADIINMKVELIPKDAARLYPEDIMLLDMNVESYFGAPMISDLGNKLGLIAVLDVEPMEVASWTGSVLGIFAQRIASYIDHKRAEEKLKKSEKKLRNIFRDMQDTYYRIDNKGKITRLSASAEKLLGYKVDELLGEEVRNLYLESDRYIDFTRQLKEMDGSINGFETGLKHKDGSVVWVSTNAHYYKDTNGNILGVEGMSRDISQRRDSELQMRKMSSALENSADMVMITNEKGIVEYVNPAFENITGYSYEEIVGGKPNIVKSNKQSHEFYNNLWKTISSGEVFSDILVNVKKNGDVYYEEKSITPIKDSRGKIINFVATGRDISERMESEERLRYMAHHDSLTALPNRTQYMDRLKKSLAHARRYEKRVAVLFVDLDRFKTINDTLGHDVGDQVLMQIAERIGINVRKEDTVARFGGDEFAILLDDIKTEQNVAHLAKKILLSLEQPLLIDKQELFISASIGISLFPNDGEEAGLLLKNADIAMYKAKDFGKNNYQFYSVEMSARSFQRLAMENSLRRALEREEFILFYQPQIDVENGNIVGVEALIRWQHAELGLVSPIDFIPLLEETGLISEVGYWVIETACKQIKYWHDMGCSSLLMSVNISGRQFHAVNFIEKIEEIVKQSGVLPETIEMEITESVLMENQKSTNDALASLDNIGFKIALDDFGTGYSSLSYLRRFRIDTLKVDRSFVRDVTDNPDDAAITSAIIAMAQSLKLKVIAEGVETKEQLKFIKQHNCRYVQGFLFSRPLPANEIEQLLMAQQNKLNKQQ